MVELEPQPRDERELPSKAGILAYPILQKIKYHLAQVFLRDHWRVNDVADLGVG